MIGCRGPLITLQKTLCLSLSLKGLYSGRGSKSHFSFKNLYSYLLLVAVTSILNLQVQQKLVNLGFGVTIPLQRIIHLAKIMICSLKFGPWDWEILGAAVLMQKDLPTLFVQMSDRLVNTYTKINWWLSIYAKILYNQHWGLLP